MFEVSFKRRYVHEVRGSKPGERLQQFPLTLYNPAADQPSLLPFTCMVYLEECINIFSTLLKSSTINVLSGRHRESRCEAAMFQNYGCKHLEGLTIRIPNFSAATRSWKRPPRANVP